MFAVLPVLDRPLRSRPRAAGVGAAARRERDPAIRGQPGQLHLRPQEPETGGRHLVIVRYGNLHNIGDELLKAVAERLRIQMVTTPPYKGVITRDMVDHELNRFYYDTAQVANEVTIQALAKLVPVSQISYGTDYPYFGFDQFAELRKLGLTAADLDAIGHENAAQLIPRVRG